MTIYEVGEMPETRFDVVGSFASRCEMFLLCFSLQAPEQKGNLTEQRLKEVFKQLRKVQKYNPKAFVIAVGLKKDLCEGKELPKPDLSEIFYSKPVIEHRIDVHWKRKEEIVRRSKMTKEELEAEKEENYLNREKFMDFCFENGVQALVETSAKTLENCAELESLI